MEEKLFTTEIHIEEPPADAPGALDVAQEAINKLETGLVDIDANLFAAKDPGSARAFLGDMMMGAVVGRPPPRETATHSISFSNGVRTVRIRCTEDGEWTFLVIDANGSRLVPVSALRVDVAE